ncbi:RNase A-like domain-containing protein [Streptomyces sp. WAC01280]|uniref:RNase A-like domain-containing protein n=1 Tax=Streptomyces sp. WAC01280 TaxID=2487424 RepID=UPI000F78E7A7|nr:RNase A-like domain-containing protein [Streptomyces sp. WAC01280]RSS56754.1 hypothetical protein EF909_11760 [Streptomyces sp. WAC01280]
MPATPPPVPSVVTNGVIDVQPLHLYAVSDAVGVEQASFHKAAWELVDILTSHSGSGGRGGAVDAFATAYAKITDLFFTAHARAVYGIGGAAVGFNQTANTFGAADAATHPGGPAFVPRNPPWVVFLEPMYGSLPRLGNGPGADGAMDSILDALSGDFGDAAMSIMRPLIDAALPTRAIAVMPLPDYRKLGESSGPWQNYVMQAGTVANQLTDTVRAITDTSPGGNSEWNAAMVSFCSSLWGTSHWGVQRHEQNWGHREAPQGISRPVLGVLTKSAADLSSALGLYAQAAFDVRKALRDLLYKAIKDALTLIDPGKGLWDNVKGLAAKLEKLIGTASVAVILSIDEPAVNAAVDKYEAVLNEQRLIIDRLEEPLNEAIRSAPTFLSQMARAEAFGARAQREFRLEFAPYPIDPPYNRWKIDLAAMEGVLDAHTIDKHVGLTTDQLAARLRDDPNEKQDRASTYSSLPAARKFTLAAVHDVQKGREIKAWLANHRKKQEEAERDKRTYAPNNPVMSFPFRTVPAEVTGMQLKRGDTEAQPVTAVQIMLMYDPRTKDFVVISSYPRAA